MKFGKYFYNLSNEMNASPALMIFIWSLSLIVNIGLFTNIFLDGIFTIIFAVNLFLSIKRYRRKY